MNRHVEPGIQKIVSLLLSYEISSLLHKSQVVQEENIADILRDKIFFCLRDVLTETSIKKIEIRRNKEINSSKPFLSGQVEFSGVVLLFGHKISKKQKFAVEFESFGCFNDIERIRNF